MVRKINTNENIISVTLKIAETTPWQAISIDGIAKVAKVEPTVLLAMFSSKLSILDAFNRQIDTRITQEFSKIEKTGSVREQLFDVIMARFDSLTPYKKALILIYNDTVPYDPFASVCGFKHLTNSMKIALNIAGISTSTPLGCIKTAILSAIFIRSFTTWLGDNSPDMAKTMAKLDNDLIKAEGLSKSGPNTT